MSTMNKHELILNFIGQYQKFGQDVIDCFTCGMCYHFAYILHSRFGHNTHIMYDPIEGHFATQIDGRMYDITGDITDQEHSWYDWESYEQFDRLERQRIIHHCVYKVPDGVRVCASCEHCYMDDWGSDICDIDNSPVDFFGPCTKGVE